MNIATTSTVKVQLRGLNGFTRSTVKVQLKGLKEFKTHELHNYIYSSLASWVELPATPEILANSQSSIF